MPHPKVHIEGLVPPAEVFRGGAFEKELTHEGADLDGGVIAYWLLGGGMDFRR